MSVVKKSVSSSTSVQQSSASQTYVMKSTSTSTSVKSATSSHKTTITGSGDDRINVDDEIQKMKRQMSLEMGRLRSEMQQLMPLERADVSGSLIKIDDATLNNFLDEGKDKFKFNFDVKEFASETVSVKSDGNKIEVHAQKKVKKGDEDETCEEYCRTYELPDGMKALEGDKLLTSANKDGVLTVELPFTAIEKLKI